MFTDCSTDRVDALDEEELLECIKGWLKHTSLEPPYGIGDDAAVLPYPGSRQVFTTDAIILNKHFTCDDTPAYAGAKLLKRNISDVVAMGAHPKQAILSLSTGKNLSLAWLKTFYEGLQKTAQRFSCAIVGGDLSSMEEGQFVASLSLIGEVLTEKPITRGTASANDNIWVTGALGGSILGRHLHFTPRLNEVKWLIEYTNITSIIDVSDGLAKDLQNLLPPHLSAVINRQQIPIHKDARKLSKTSQLTPEEHAWSDGEDYELLFTTPPLNTEIGKETLQSNFLRATGTNLTCLGTCRPYDPQDEARFICAHSQKPINTGNQGYSHF